MQSNFELFESFKLFDWLIHKLNYYKRVKDCEHIDITKGQGRIMAVLSMEDSLKTKELATRVGMNTSSINELLSKMEQNGLVKRQPSKKDKRVIVNCLTQKAKDSRPKLKFKFFNCLTPDEKHILLELMTKLNKHLENEIISISGDSFKNEYNKRQNAICILRDLNKTDLEEVNSSV